MNISQNLRQIIFSLLIVIVFVSFILSYAITNIAGVLLFVMFFLDDWVNIKKKLTQAYNDKIVRLFWFLFIAQVIGYFYSDNTEFAQKRIQVFLPILYLPLILRTEQISVKYLNKILNALKIIIPLIFAVLICYHLFILNKTINTFIDFTVIEILGVSQFYIVFILIIPILECIRQIYINNKLVFNISLLTLNVFSVLLLSNKTTFFFLLILGIGYIFKMFHQNKKKALLMFFAFGTLIILALQINVVNNKLNVFLKTTDFSFNTIVTKNKYAITKNTAEHRVLINFVSLKAISQSLPFGFGTGDYMEVLLKGYEDLKFKAGIYSKYNAHNQYLEEFLKTGIIGGSIFICLMIFLLIEINSGNWFRPVILFFLFACFFESYLYRQHGIYILSFILPFLIFNTNKLAKK
jgi:O-antigen ligase